MQTSAFRYFPGMSTVLIIVIAIIVIAIVVLALRAGRNRRHTQLRETAGEHRQAQQQHANRANELEAAAAEAREREHQHATNAAEAEQKLPDRS